MCAWVAACVFVRTFPCSILDSLLITSSKISDVESFFHGQLNRIGGLSLCDTPLEIFLIYFAFAPKILLIYESSFKKWILNIFLLLID